MSIIDMYWKDEDVSIETTDMCEWNSDKYNWDGDVYNLDISKGDSDVCEIDSGNFIATVDVYEKYTDSSDRHVDIPAGDTDISNEDSEVCKSDINISIEVHKCCGLVTICGLCILKGSIVITGWDTDLSNGDFDILG